MANSHLYVELTISFRENLCELLITRMTKIFFPSLAFKQFTVDELKERTQAIYEEIVEIVPTVTAVIEKGQTVFAEEIAAIRETKTLPTNFSVGKLLQMPVDLIKDAFSKFLGIFTSIANLFTSMFKKGSQ